MKTATGSVLETFRNTATKRQSFENDKYAQATRQILLHSDSDSALTLRYHPYCRKNYSAVKRSMESQADMPQSSAKKSCIQTRRDSSMPKFDHGLLKGTCIFCGKARKKRAGKEERLFKVATWKCCDTLADRAKRTSNERIKSLVYNNVDLIAAEAEYHRCCRLDFDAETKPPTEPTKTGMVKPPPNQSACHKKAFTKICSLIEIEVVDNKRALLISSLLEQYRTEFVCHGGDKDDAQRYQSQNLVRKIKEHFNDKIRIRIADRRRGNFIYSSMLTDDEGFANLHEDSTKFEEDQRLTWAALHMRNLIMQLPKTRTPDPANVQSLKSCAPDIPRQIDLFFRTLLNGRSPTFKGSKSEVVDRKVSSMASDTIYNVSR